LAVVRSLALPRRFNLGKDDSCFYQEVPPSLLRWEAPSSHALTTCSDSMCWKRLRSLRSGADRLHLGEHFLRQRERCGLDILAQVLD
jgi:hypothetical protein